MCCILTFQWKGTMALPNKGVEPTRRSARLIPGV
jgi:hypothetical protein